VAGTGRHKRVKAMRVVFGALALLFVASWLLARTTGANAAKEATTAAQARATSYATTISRITTTRGGQPDIAQKAFDDAVERDTATDPTVARIRVWRGGGQLAASTDPRDAGKDVSAGAGLHAAMHGDTTSEDGTATYVPVGGGGPTTADLTQTFVALRGEDGGQPIGAVEVDFVRARLVTPAWRTMSVALAAGAVFFGLLFVFSMTRPAPTQGSLKKVEPPMTSPTIRHDYGAATHRATSGWVPPASDSPPPSTSVAELEAATARIAELEGALKRAADEADQVRSQAASQERDIERIQQEARARVAALEEQMRADDPEIEALRSKLDEAEARAAEAEFLLVTAREEIAEAHAQVGDTRVHDDVDEAEEAVSDPAPVSEPEPTDPTDLIAVLEAKVAEAEARAQYAKDEAMQLSPEASDLRTRLARTAARKKMGSAG
jgi:hypothetical protein